MDSAAVAQAVAQAPAFFFKHESSKGQAFYSSVPTLPSTPIYSRPGSSSCSQPPTLLSNGPSVMSSLASPSLIHHKPVIMLETELGDSPYFPSTPPLSTSGSAIGSPKSFDMLQPTMNPMLSGLEDLSAIKSGLDPVESFVLDWSSCGSPPMTPVYIQPQPTNVSSLNGTTSDLSTASCPSLSPSPTPYARSIASEHDVDFCDPRNLTVSSSASSNPTLAPECKLTAFGEDEPKSEQHVSQPAFVFPPSVPNDLPPFEDLSDLDSESDFGVFVNLGERASADISRPRACTGSSVVSLGHGSFISDEDFGFDESEAFSFPSLPSPPSSVDPDEETHKDKRQKKNSDSAHVVEDAMNSPAGDAETGSGQHASDKTESVASDSGASSAAPSAHGPSAPTSRRGRKQSLTEDPSKTFVCDLCNRRFRRQEHLKRHYRSLHTQEKPFECTECGKKFSRSDNLAQHARTHAGGAIVMNLIENGEVAPYNSAMVGPSGVDDYANFGKVLFQIASEVPGSASEQSSEEGSEQGKKKRKRSD